jgi:hypothetical protein
LPIAISIGLGMERLLARHGAAFLDEKAALASRWLGCAFGNRSTRSVSVARISSGQDEFLLLQSKGTDNVHR